ncbi:MAG: YCF48-related protein [Ignavibacteria bacterium]
MEKIRLKLFLIMIFLLSIVQIGTTQTGWIDMSIGTRNYVAINFTDDNNGFIFASDGVILKSTNRGITWQAFPNSFPLTVKTGLSVNENLYFVISGGSASGMVNTTTNGGGNWVNGENFFTPLGSGFNWLRNLTFVNQTTGYVCGNEYGYLNGQLYVAGIIYKTTNSGSSWFLSTRRGFDYNDIRFLDESTGYAVLGGVIKTTDSGNNWSYTGQVFSQTFSLSHPFNDTLYMSSTNGNVHKSINGGVLDNHKHIFDRFALKIYFVNSLTGYTVGTLGTIAKTTNGGENWFLQESNTTKRLNSVYMINDSDGFIVGDSGKILKTTTGGVLTGFTNLNTEIPDKYSLSQNYPNPFNPSTVISYELPVTKHVKLVVYDVLGNEVAALVNENKPAGSYEVLFEGSNYPSGVYFYRLEVEDNILDTKRMVLLK